MENGYRIIEGDVLDGLAMLGAGTVQTCVTSPPYWGLRDYKVPPTQWPAVEYAPMPGLPIVRIEAMECCLGLEEQPEQFIGHMVHVTREIWRVLRDDGTLWLNIGDSYAGSWGAQSRGETTPGTLEGGDMSFARKIAAHPKKASGTGSMKRTPGRKPKDLLGVPWLLAFALQADGWWLRSDIIWAKPNPMPESVTDRPTKAHEYVFLLAKSERYYFDQEAVREDGPTYIRKAGGYVGFDSTHVGNNQRGGFADKDTVTSGRNLRSVWTIATESFPGAHFATYPQALVEPCIKAGTSERGCCPECGAPWVRVVERTFVGSYHDHKGDGIQYGLRQNGKGPKQEYDIPRTTGWRPTCDHGEEPVPATVCDPFMGSGATALVARRLGRKAIGIDLNAAYLDMAINRCRQAVLV